MTSYGLIDLKQKSDFDKYYGSYQSLLHSADEDFSFKLRNNYKAINLENFLAFTCLINDSEQVVAFSGLQKKPFPGSCARVLSRLYYGPSIRTKGYHSFPSVATKLMLPHQLDIAKKHNLSYVFISLQNDLNRNFFVKSYTKKLNNFFPDLSWNLLDGAYNTCRLIDGRQNEDPSCWQTLIAASLDGSENTPTLFLPRKPHA